MIGDLASVCILSYDRPEFLREVIPSARDNAGYRHELIVNDDGSKNGDCYNLLNQLLGVGVISQVLYQPPGHNQGVGESIRKCFGVASGDVLVKVDQDLIFKPDWLKKAIDILFDVVEVDGVPTRIGALGLFTYRDLADERFRTITEYGRWRSVTDFVGSAFLIARDIYEKVGPIPTHSTAFAEDVELKQRLRDAGYLIALPTEDLCTNRGFGVGPSTVVTAFDPATGQGEVQSIHQSAVLFGA